MKDIKLIGIRLKDGKRIDIVLKKRYAESEFYITFADLKKINRYLRANNINTPVSSKVLNKLLQLNMIKRTNGK